MTIDILLEVIPSLDVRLHPHEAIGSCPFCNKQSHFFINKTSFKWDCKKCNRNGSLFGLLQKLDRLDLFEADDSIRIKDIDAVDIKNLRTTTDVLMAELQEVSLPRFSKNINRGDEFWKYLIYERGMSAQYLLAYGKQFFCNRVLRKYRGYLIIPIIENNTLYGYVGRDITNSPEKRRYINSTGTQFRYLLGGYDNIKDGDHVVICEGYFDMLSFADYTTKYNLKNIVPVCTWGKKISEHQIYKLRLRGIQTVTFFWDYDAISSMRRYGQRLSKFFEVSVAFFMDDSDLGSQTKKAIHNIFNSRINFSSFAIEFVEIRNFT